MIEYLINKKLKIERELIMINRFLENNEHESYRLHDVRFNNVDDHIDNIMRIINEYGFVVLENMIDKNECDKYVDQSVKWMLDKLSPELSMDYKTWNNKNLPSGPRLGMYQSIISHCPVAWKIREIMYPLFCSLYDTKELITSIDGATILPPIIPNKVTHSPHVDQTTKEPVKVCYQGQAVLNDSTACFVCIPKSHLYHKNFILDTKSEWHRFGIEELNKIFGDNCLTPIYSGKGSIILWKSTLIHTSQYVDNIVEPMGYNGWRCTYYVCQRPKRDFKKTGLKTIKNATLNGRTTNHWGTKTFPKTTRWDKQSKNSKVYDLLTNTEILVYDDLTDIQKKLTGILEYE